MKNAFYLTLKALFVLKIIEVLPSLFGCVEERVDQKDQFSFMVSQPGRQTFAIHIPPNNWKRKDNQLMKFGPIIEYNMKNIFLHKSYTKNGG